MKGPVQQSMARLGVAALALSAKMERFFKQLVTEEALRAQSDQFTQAAIVFTTQLIAACDVDRAVMPEDARDLEERLMSGLKGIAEVAADLQQSVEDLVDAGAAYAQTMTDLVEHCATSREDPRAVSVEARAVTLALARAAVMFTRQLMITCSADQAAARMKTGALELHLIARLDEAYVPLPQEVLS